MPNAALKLFENESQALQDLQTQAEANIDKAAAFVVAQVIQVEI